MRTPIPFVPAYYAETTAGTVPVHPTCGVRKLISMLICFPPKWYAHLHIALQNLFFFSLDQNLNASNSSSHHAPYLAIPPSMHFFTSSQPPLTDKTERSQNYDSSVWTGARKFRAGSLRRVKDLQNDLMDHTPISQDELSKAFCLQLYHLWRLLSIAFSYMTCTTALSLLHILIFTITSTTKF